MYPNLCKAILQMMHLHRRVKQTACNAIWEGMPNEMGRRHSVSENEKAEIVQMLTAKVQTVDSAKRLKQDHRPINLNICCKYLYTKEEKGRCRQKKKTSRGNEKT